MKSNARPLATRRSPTPNSQLNSRLSLYRRYSLTGMMIFLIMINFASSKTSSATDVTHNCVQEFRDTTSPSLLNLKSPDGGSSQYSSSYNNSPDYQINLNAASQTLSGASSDASIFSFNISEPSLSPTPNNLSPFSKSLRSFRQPRPLSPLVTCIMNGLGDKKKDKNEEEEIPSLKRTPSYKRSVEGKRRIILYLKSGILCTYSHSKSKLYSENIGHVDPKLYRSISLDSYDFTTLSDDYMGKIYFQV